MENFLYPGAMCTTSFLLLTQYLLYPQLILMTFCRIFPQKIKPIGKPLRPAISIIIILVVVLVSLQTQSEK